MRGVPGPVGTVGLSCRRFGAARVIRTPHDEGFGCVGRAQHAADDGFRGPSSADFVPGAAAILV